MSNTDFKSFGFGFVIVTFKVYYLLKTILCVFISVNGSNLFAFNFKLEHDINGEPQVQVAVRAAVSGCIGSKAVV